MEGKGVWVNVDKTKGMQLLFRKKSSVSKWILVVSVGSGLVLYSIKCTKCQRWVHRYFHDVPRQVNLLSCLDVFVCRTCLGPNCTVEEKLEFKRGEDMLEEVEKFCYLGDVISCYGGAFDARIGSAWKKFKELSGVLVGKHSLSLKQRGKVYQWWERTVADEVILRGVERRMIRMMCGVRLVDRVSTDVLRDRVSVAVEIEDIIQSHLPWYDHAIRRDINS